MKAQLKNVMMGLLFSFVSVSASASYGEIIVAPPAPPVAPAPVPSAPLVETLLADGRNIVTTAEGLSVYTFDIDQNGISKCYNSCAKAWPPVLVESAEGLQSPIGVTTRNDGKLQLTVDGQPVYLFIGDKVKGDINGDGLDDVWHLIVR